ncbi:hypothetical protein GN956_G18352 [Arapaima gigas]
MQLKQSDRSHGVWVRARPGWRALASQLNSTVPIDGSQQLFPGCIPTRPNQAPPPHGLHRGAGFFPCYFEAAATSYMMLSP